MIEIKNLSVETHDGKEIIKNLRLKLEKGKVYALMGENGSGKSTLANVIVGNPRYKIKKGGIVFEKKDITKESVDKRAKIGMFISFQNPKEIPGVSFVKFLREAKNSQGNKKISVLEFRELIEKNAKKLDSEKLLERNLNEGFSGGEKKKSEIIQMLILDPKFAILDEPDSGLDIDGLKNLSKVLKNFKKKDKTILIISHYTKLLKYLKPDKNNLEVFRYYHPDEFKALKIKAEAAGLRYVFSAPLVRSSFLAESVFENLKAPSLE